MSEIQLTEDVAPGTPATGKVLIYAKGDGSVAKKADDGTEVNLGSIPAKSIIIESPSANEDLSFFFTDVALTITKIRVVLVGSSIPSVTWTLRHGTDRSSAGTEVVIGGTVTTNTGVGAEITSFDDPSLVANAHCWLETTAKSGTVDSIIITVFF